MIEAAIAKRLRMPAVIGVNKTVGYTSEQQVEAHADDRKKANAESEGYRFRVCGMVEAAAKPCDHGPEVNQREKMPRPRIKRLWRNAF